MGPGLSGRSGHVMASDGTQIFVLGGLSRGDDEAKPVYVVDTSTYFRFCYFIGRPSSFKTGHIEYPKHDANSVKPRGEATQLMRESSKGPQAQEQPQRLTSFSSDAHAIQGPQKVTPEELGRPTSPQLTHERNPSPIGLTSLPEGVNGKPGHVLKKVNIVAPGASSEGEVAQVEHERIVELERQLELAKANAMKATKRAELDPPKQADQVLVQTSRVNQTDAELVGQQAMFEELLLSPTQDARALDQAQSALQKAKADADEQSQRACKQLVQYEMELAKVSTELQASPFTTACASAPVRAGSSKSLSRTQHPVPL
jgi:hypothetical protein